MRVLLDNNVILDAMLKRVPWDKDADGILQAAANNRVSCALTTLSLATIFYVGRRAVGTPAARAEIQRFLAAFEILPIDKQTLLDADAMLGTDFEDNILLAAAISASVDAIVTRNPKDFAQSSIPVWEPADLLSRLSSGSSPPSGASGPAPGPP